ncbi:DUF975 family protein [Streptococcus tangpeifui]|uniref:DUF975 family protein n=1 Tax=Streptococcus tangpeifui TaxID=2709400 RepID=UPI0013E9F1E5|nr:MULTISPECIES: DUF975 family protein [unclassified Streptococcus]
MKTRKDLKEQAKTALRGNWPWAVGVLWVPTIILGLISTFLLGVLALVWRAASSDFTATSNVVLIFIVMAFLLLVLFTFFASVGIGAGASYAYLDLIRGRKQSFREAATYAFKEQRFDSIFGVVLMTAIYTLLWMVLLIIPGYMKAVSYSQGLFILKDDMEAGKGITTTSAITKSKVIMEGHKRDYFMLILSFSRWFLVPAIFVALSVFLFANQQVVWGAFFFLCYFLTLAVWIPYVATTQAAFYEDLIHQEQPKEIVQLEEKLANAKLEADKAMSDYNDRIADRKADKKKAHDKKMAKKLKAKKEREEQRRERVAKKRREREEKEAKNPKKKASKKSKVADKQPVESKKTEKLSKKVEDAKPETQEESNKKIIKAEKEVTEQTNQSSKKSGPKSDKVHHSTSKKPKTKAKKKKGKKRK